MDSMTLLKQAKERLKEGGYGGLYCEGECGCTVDDLAPCGECDRNENGWINTCLPGYKHVDPRNGEFVVSPRATPPTPEEFDRIFAGCG